jgi:carbonic anhydrase
VKPETVFDEPFGSLLVVHTTENSIDAAARNIIDYAIEHFHAGLLIVLGHTSYSTEIMAVQSGSASKKSKNIHNQCISTNVSSKAHSVESSPEKVKENINNQISQLRFKSDLLYQSEHEKKILIVGAVYDGKIGKVNFFN